MQSGDQRQDFGEQPAEHRDLGELERDVSAVTDDLRTDLDQLLAQASQRPCRHRILYFCAGRQFLSCRRKMK